MRTDFEPLCATDESTVAVPVPWQLAYDVPQTPDTVDPVWLSNPSQNAAVVQVWPPGLVLVLVLAVGPTLVLGDRDAVGEPVVGVPPFAAQDSVGAVPALPLPSMPKFVLP